MPTVETLGVLAGQILFILIVVNQARKKREYCLWQPAKVKKQIWLASGGIIFFQVSPAFAHTQIGSPLGIVCQALSLYSVFLFSRALYRRADLLKLSNSLQSSRPVVERIEERPSGSVPAATALPVDIRASDKSPMWYPNKTQWWVLWITAVLVVFLILMTMEGDNVPSRLGASVIIIAVLLIWQLSKKKT